MRSRGFALPLLLLLMFGAGTGLALALMHTLPQMERRQQSQTERALRQARDALLAYAAREDNVPGTLLCPDYDGNGTADYALSGSPCSHGVMGRLPWRTLGIEALRDGSGQCLWYVISPGAENRTPTEARARPFNPGYPGELPLRDRASGSEQTVVALLIAPGRALAAQRREGDGCGPSAVAGFLEGGNRSGTPFEAGPSTADFNDSVLSITTPQLVRVTAPHVLLALAGAGPAATDSALRGMLASGASAISLQSPTNAARLRLDFLAPDVFMQFSPHAEPAADAPCARYGSGKYAIEWLCYNRWLDYVDYQPLSSTSARLGLSGWQLDAAPHLRPHLKRRAP